MQNLYGIIGHPVEHSLSPKMFNSGFKYLKIDADYQKFDIEPDNLGDFVKNYLRKNLKGASITIPYKISIIPFLDKIEEVASKIGAVNTVINKDEFLIGTNTDFEGAMEALKEAINPLNKQVLLIGAGGASRAIAYGLFQHNAKVVISNRDVEKARALAEIHGFKYDSIDNLMNYKDIEILINATSIGMSPNIEISPVNKDFLNKNIVVFDVVYKPLQTQLIKDALEKGRKVVTGEKMLLYQAVRQFELWTGVKAPIEIMRGALISGLE